MRTRLIPAERHFWLRWVLATALGSLLVKIKTMREEEQARKAAIK